jgi:cell division protein ZapA (FtsZ GTPase activity inhibitor)
MEKDETLNKESKKSPVTKKKVVRKSSKARLALLNQYREHAIDNEIEIVQSNQCGCFFCRHVFDARDVQDWMDGEHGVTALCPECGMDAVIGDASGIEIDKPLMKEMNLAFYGETYMQDNPEAARTYCIRYIDGKIAALKKTRQYGRQNSELRGVMLWLNLADDYMQAREEADRLKAEAEERETEIYALKRELVGKRLDAEAAEGKIKEAKQKLKEANARIQELESEVNELLEK